MDGDDMIAAGEICRSPELALQSLLDETSKMIWIKLMPIYEPYWVGNELNTNLFATAFRDAQALSLRWLLCMMKAGDKEDIEKSIHEHFRRMTFVKGATGSPYTKKYSAFTRSQLVCHQNALRFPSSSLIWKESNLKYDENFGCEFHLHLITLWILTDTKSCHLVKSLMIDEHKDSSCS